MRKVLLISIVSFVFTTGLSMAAEEAEALNYTPMEEQSEFNELDTTAMDELDEVADDKRRRRLIARCTVGLSLYRGVYVRIFRARAWGLNRWFASRRACRIAWNNCQRYDRRYFFGAGRCAVLRRY